MEPLVELSKSVAELPRETLIVMLAMGVIVLAVYAIHVVHVATRPKQKP